MIKYFLFLTNGTERTFSQHKSACKLQQELSAKFVHFFKFFVLFSVICLIYGVLNLKDQIQVVESARSKRSVSSDRKLLAHLSDTAFDTNYTKRSEDSSLQHPIENCIRPAILEFPTDGFTRAQRQHGWILLHILIVLYCFWLLAAICDDYFVSAIEQICSTLNMQKDVIGATVMAIATSSPELFMNCIGTFVTKGDIGVGTIVGSAVFNILAVPACCGLFTGQFVRLHWWSVTRDCLWYFLAVLALIAILYDGKVMWYEAAALVVAYFFYIAAMYYNDKMARTARRLISKYRRRNRTPRPYREVNEITPLLAYGQLIKSDSKSESSQQLNVDVEKCEMPDEMTESMHSVSSNDSDCADSPWVYNGSCIYEHILRWPITFLLWLTIPDSRLHPQYKYLSFTMSIVWIGVMSYVVAYLVTIIGDTFNIPDSVMGLTILAAGMSVPEAVSSIIVTKRGKGEMGISNSIGSNTFDILLCLGIPWFVKAYFLPVHPEEHWLTLNSNGLNYSAFFLLTTLFGLYLAFVLNKFVLDWKIGIACTVMYIIFMLLASMIELNCFFPVNLPVCAH